MHHLIKHFHRNTLPPLLSKSYAVLQALPLSIQVPTVHQGHQFWHTSPHPQASVHSTLFFSQVHRPMVRSPIKLQVTKSTSQVPQEQCRPLNILALTFHFSSPIHIPEQLIFRQKAGYRRASDAVETLQETEFPVQKVPRVHQVVSDFLRCFFLTV